MKNIIASLLIITTISSFAFQENKSEELNNVVKKYYYDDGIISKLKWYNGDKKLDSLKTYYKSGELNEDFHYTNGYYDGLSYQYNKKGEKLTTWKFEKSKLIERIDHIIEFNKKTEKKVKSAHVKLKELNERITNKDSLWTRALPTRARIRAYLGNNTLAMNDYKKFEKYISKIKKTKKVPEKILGSVYDHIASIYSKYEMENHTIHYKIKALKASPNESRLYYNLGSYLVRIGSYRLGIEYLNKAIEMVPNHSFANWGLAIAYTDLEDYEKAMTSVNIAFKNEATIYKRSQGTSERDLRTIRGLLYHKLGETDKGIDDLEEALNINSDNSFALRNLGVIYHDIGNYIKSCELLEKAKKLGYEKTHDKYDIEDYLEHSCNNKITEHELIKLSERPFVYPNPAENDIAIYHYNFKNFNYRIYNFETKLMGSGKAENKTINISNLPSGLYILEVEADGMLNTFKVVKQ